MNGPIFWCWFMNGTNFLTPMYMHICFVWKGIIIQRTVYDKSTFCEIKYTNGLLFFSKARYMIGLVSKYWLAHPYQNDPFSAEKIVNIFLPIRCSLLWVHKRAVQMRPSRNEHDKNKTLHQKKNAWWVIIDFFALKERQSTVKRAEFVYCPASQEWKWLHILFTTLSGTYNR